MIERDINAVVQPKAIQSSRKAAVAQENTFESFRDCFLSGSPYCNGPTSSKGKSTILRAATETKSSAPGMARAAPKVELAAAIVPASPPSNSKAPKTYSLDSVDDANFFVF